MSAGNVHDPAEGAPAAPKDDGSRKREILLFLLLAVVIWPFIAVAVVAGWGFVVWMYQAVTGPPGPPL